jgi:hypothetical protein
MPGGFSWPLGAFIHFQIKNSFQKGGGAHFQNHSSMEKEGGLKWTKKR